MFNRIFNDICDIVMIAAGIILLMLTPLVLIQFGLWCSAIALGAGFIIAMIGVDKLYNEPWF